MRIRGKESEFRIQNQESKIPNSLKKCPFVLGNIQPLIYRHPMKPLTTSVYTFSKLIDGGFLYVDKTAGIYDLLRPATGQYFLSRPRRFGKSLLISTLRAIFEGRRELFAGLDILNTKYDWKVHPVIHLDLGDREATTAAILNQSLLACVRERAKDLDIDLTNETAASAFRELVVKLSRRDGQVVILIDEYDKPLLSHLGADFSSEIQTTLKNFYSVIKSTEEYQRFVLLTGVSKFSKVSIFSDLNNLTDLTMRRSTATLLGYTEAELQDNFPDYIEQLAIEEGKTIEETRAIIRDWYNGYRFEERAQTVYNPVSVMKCFQEMKLKNYWFETGTPSFLINLLRSKPINFDDLSVPETAFSAYEANHLEPLPLLVQTGYLTIKDVTMAATGRRRQYRLGFPNYEIEESFSMWLAEGFSVTPQEELNSALNRMLAALNKGDIDETLETLKIFFANIPNTITLKHEKYYQTIFFTVFKLIGASIDAEVSTNIGRIDAVVKTETDIYIFEFKLHDTAENAVKQIQEKNYAQPYLNDGRPITLIGAAFDGKERNITTWVTEEEI